VRSCWNDAGPLAQFCGANGALAGTNVSLRNTLGCASDSATRLGWTVGAGLEYALVRKLDAEGRVSLTVDYGTTTYFNPAVTLPGFTVVPRDLATFNSIARTGTNYKFGATVASPGIDDHRS
jgi:opacity protein-like surface antigen